MYLEQITFPDQETEFDFFLSIQRTVYDSYYPFQILSARRFQQIDFEPITILYGGNGSGKTTALNVIAEKIHAQRFAAYNRSNFSRTIYPTVLLVATTNRKKKCY